MKRMLAVLLAGALIASLAGPASAGKKKKKKLPIEKVLFTDVEGDADVGQGLGASLPGFDLIEGKVKKVDDTLEFTIAHAGMPPTGTLPEAVRFLWAFNVDGANYRLTIKTADIGKPDVAAGQTTERVGRVDATGHFRLEGECVQETIGIGFVNCPPLEYLTGSFDNAAGTMTMVVPLASLEAKSGSVIGPGGGNNAGICAICWVSHYAERSLNTTVIDGAASAEEYIVP